jgi:hypothetical protein
MKTHHPLRLIARPLVLGLLAVFIWIADASAAPLHDAAKAGDVAEVRRLLQAGANVEAGNKDGETPLHRAARGGHAEIVAFGKGARKAGQRSGGIIQPRRRKIPPFGSLMFEQSSVRRGCMVWRRITEFVARFCATV